jgi:hypothetical protein
MVEIFGIAVFLLLVPESEVLFQGIKQVLAQSVAKILPTLDYHAGVFIAFVGILLDPLACARGPEILLHAVLAELQVFGVIPGVAQDGAGFQGLPGLAGMIPPCRGPVGR